MHDQGQRTRVEEQKHITKKLASFITGLALSTMVRNGTKLMSEGVCRVSEQYLLSLYKQYSEHCIPANRPDI